MHDVYTRYPVTIVSDRYQGVYSGGRWVAWNLDSEDIPTEPDCGDMTAGGFWASMHADLVETGTTRFGPIGFGQTPGEALKNLQEQLTENNNWHARMRAKTRGSHEQA